jgi:putative intracellular protease/amidase
MQLLENTPAIASLNMSDFDAIVVCGGQSPMFTFRQNSSLIQLFADFYATGKPTAALCHGTCVLLEAKLPDGNYLIQGKNITGFANSEEDYGDKVVGQKMMLFRIEDEANKLGANFVTKEAFASHAVQDGNLITGQQQNSGAETAKFWCRNSKTGAGSIRQLIEVVTYGTPTIEIAAHNAKSALLVS